MQDSYTVCEPKLVYDIIKRLADVACAVCAGLVLLIPMADIAIGIRLESEGPAIFKQHRMEHNGKVFTIYKFRTMKITAPDDLPTKVVPSHSGYMTRLGRFLRKTSMDELPQLFNVIRGDMSLAGYRPLSLSEVEANEMRRRTGVFQVRSEARYPRESETRIFGRKGNAQWKTILF